MEIVAETPGLALVAAAQVVTPTLEAISAAAVALAQREWVGSAGTFAIDSRRPNKHFPLSSPDLNRHVGTLVGAATGLGVNLRTPDHTLWIDVDVDEAYLWTHVRPGPGGMPVGTAGKVMLMLSGGIDSPVAGYLAQKRGCSVAPVYFHSPPFVSEDSRAKVVTLARQLAARQDGLSLRVVPFTAIQEAIRDNCDGRLAVLLYRRFMYRIAHVLAAQARCVALCTGECLAQVASQTLENLNLVEQLGPRMTLRPLLTYDKNDIMQLAQKIGSYDTSILPFDDCCTLFVPGSPATKARLPQIERSESRIDVAALVADAVARTEIVSL